MRFLPKFALRKFGLPLGVSLACQTAPLAAHEENPSQQDPQTNRVTISDSFGTPKAVNLDVNTRSSVLPAEEPNNLGAEQHESAPDIGYEEEFSFSIKEIGKRDAAQTAENEQTDESDLEDEEETPIANLDGVSVSTAFYSIEKPAVSHNVGGEHHLTPGYKPQPVAGTEQKRLAQQPLAYHVSGSSEDQEAALRLRDIAQAEASAQLLYTIEKEVVEVVPSLGGDEHTSASPQKVASPGYQQQGHKHPIAYLKNSGTSNDEQARLNDIAQAEASGQVLYTVEQETVVPSLGGNEHTPASPQKVTSPGYQQQGHKHPIAYLKNSGISNDEQARLNDIAQAEASGQVLYTVEKEPVVPSLGGDEHTPASPQKVTSPGYQQQGHKHPIAYLKNSGTSNDAVAWIEEPASTLPDQAVALAEPVQATEYSIEQNVEIQEGAPQFGAEDHYGPEEESVQEQIQIEEEPEPTPPPPSIANVQTAIKVATLKEKVKTDPHKLAGNRRKTEGVRGTQDLPIKLDSSKATTPISGGFDQKSAKAVAASNKIANQRIKEIATKTHVETVKEPAVASLGSHTSSHPKKPAGSLGQTFADRNSTNESGSSTQQPRPVEIAALDTPVKGTIPKSEIKKVETKQNQPLAQVQTPATSPASPLTEPVPVTPIPEEPATPVSTPAPVTQPSVQTPESTAPASAPTPESALPPVTPTPVAPAETPAPVSAPTPTPPQLTAPAPQPATPVTTPAAAPGQPTLPPLNPALNPTDQSEATRPATDVNANQDTVAQAAPAPINRQQEVLIKFNNVSVIEYIGFISRLTGKNFVFDEADLNFNVTIVSNEPTSIDNVMAALLQSLRVQGLSLMEVGNNLIIHRNRKANAPADVVIANSPRTNADIVTRVFRLSNSDPEKMAEIIRPMLSDLSIVAPMPQTGHLLVTDLTANVDKINDLIRSLDASRSGFEIGRYVVVYTSLDSAITLAKSIMDPIAQGKTLNLIPDAATNSIFIVSTPNLLQRTIAVLQQIDVDQGSTTIFSLDKLRVEGLPSGEETTEEPQPSISQGTSQPITSSTIFPSTEIQDTTVRLNDGSVQQLVGGVRQTDGTILFNDGSSLNPDGTIKTPQGQVKGKVTQVVSRGKPPAPVREERLGTEKAKGTNIGKSEPIEFKIFKLRHRKGEQLATSFQLIGKSLRSSSPQNLNTPYLNLIAALDSVQWVEGTNSLVFSGTRRSLDDIGALIERLDVQVRQVLIEMLIIETSIEDSLRYGVEWGSKFYGEDLSGAQAFLGSNTSPLQTTLNGVNNLNPLTQGSIIDATTLDPSGLITQQGFSIGVIGRSVIRAGFLFPTIGALVTALHSDEMTNIIMNPKIVVEENTPAEIFVGINTSFRTQSIANDQGQILTSNFEFRDIGVKLKVTPYISNDDIITLEIEQEISSIIPVTQLQLIQQGSPIISTNASTLNAVSPGPTTRKSNTTTKVHMPDRFFLILSGMIQDQNIQTNAQIPCLGGVPILGGAARQMRYDDSKRNLMIFIRPQIIENDEIHRATKRQQDLYVEKTRQKNREDYEVDTALEFLNIKWDPCDPNAYPEFNYQE